MERSVVFSGFGGQGLLFAGQALARAAMADGLEVFWIPSYGPEMRGGTASCTVIVGDAQIGSPVVDRFDAAVAMNLPALRKYAPRVAAGGLVVSNCSLTGDETSGRADVAEVRLGCADIAAVAADGRLASVAALGALVARTGWVEAASARSVLRAMVGKAGAQAVEADLAAFDAGFAAAGGTA